MKNNEPEKLHVLHEQFFSYLGKSKTEVLPHLIKYSTSCNKTFTDFLTKSKKTLPDIFEVRVKDITLICEFEKGICASTYLFFDTQTDTDSYIKFCNDSFIKSTDNTWLVKSCESSDVSYTILCFNLTKKHKPTTIFFQCITTKLPINDYKNF